MLKRRVVDKYRLYEAAVQDANQQVGIAEQVYKENFHSEPQVLKEDFCGTSWISCEWVTRGEHRESFGLDIDVEALEVGEYLHRRHLAPEQRKRVKLMRQNVLQPTAKKADAVAACNFSYFIFQQRGELLDYFHAAYESLKSNGVFLLETAGGPGFVEAPYKEARSIKHSAGKKKGKKWFRYTWHQRSFDPQYRRGLYSIHFELANGKKWKDAFVYDWRIWTIPEVRDVLLEVGFDDVQVYWEEDDPDEEGYPIYSRREQGDSEFDTWIVYIVGVKKGTA